jgi:hypothetical protein
MAVVPTGAMRGTLLERTPAQPQLGGISGTTVFYSARRVAVVAGRRSSAKQARFPCMKLARVTTAASFARCSCVAPMAMVV